MNAPVETLISVANFLVAAGTLALTFRKVQMEQQSRGREAEEKKITARALDRIAQAFETIAHGHAHKGEVIEGEIIDAEPIAPKLTHQDSSNIVPLRARWVVEDQAKNDDKNPDSQTKEAPLKLKYGGERGLSCQM
ncbi:MAG: hypothetical protein WC043_07235 [Pseudobdellovibrionaceae bacterium]